LTGKIGKDQTQRHSGQNWCFRCISAHLSGKFQTVAYGFSQFLQEKVTRVLSHFP